MDFHDMTQRALAVREAYTELNTLRGKKPWGATEYLTGFMGDVGDLAKLIMAKESFRRLEGVVDVDQQLAHELSDCLFSILMLAHSLNIDLEPTFVASMDKFVQHVRGVAARERAAQTEE